MGLMLARVGNSLRSPVASGVLAFGGAATASTALTTAYQFGRGDDFSKPAPPSAGGMSLVLGGGLFASIVSGLMIGIEQQYRIGAIGLGVSGGAAVGVAILNPVARRLAADS